MNAATTTTAEELSAAFAEFEGASRELSGFYRELERQVTVLAGELQQSRAAQARQLAEKQRLAARLENLLGALPGGVVVLDQRGLVQEFNPVADDLLGPLATGESWHNIVERAFQPRWDDGHDVSLGDGRRVNIATQALSGEPGQILLLTDVTETRRLLEQLAHHKRLSAKTEMAAAMAHQIRTPVAAALLNVGNLRKAPNENFRARAVDRALGSLRKLERLVEDMLLFARGRQFDVSAIALSDLVTALQRSSVETFDSGEFVVEFEQSALDGEVYANLDALLSVALNLIENSQQACRGHGTLRIEAGIENNSLALRFADDGPGIEAAQQAMIFEPFHSTRSSGTGLGLPVARAVARAHGGDLELEPSATGACFVMRLPLAGDRGEPLVVTTPTTE